MSIAKRFGANVRAWRKHAGLSQEEVALRASLHRTEVSLLERGGRLPRIDTAVKLAGALGVGAGDLFEGIAWQPGKVSPGHFESR